jgi:rhodanese-related sulfurtransferase
VARLLMDRGFTKVRPLAGGLEAWREAGYEVEAEAPDGRERARLPVIDG